MNTDFEDTVFTASRSVGETQIEELCSPQWLRDSQPILPIGQTGAGKTIIAQAAGLHSGASAKSAIYTTLTT